MNRVKFDVVVLDHLHMFSFRISFEQIWGKKKKRREENFLKVLKFYKNLSSWKEESRVFSAHVKCFLRNMEVHSVNSFNWRESLEN